MSEILAYCMTFHIDPAKNSFAAHQGKKNIYIFQYQWNAELIVFAFSGSDSAPWCKDIYKIAQSGR